MTIQELEQKLNEWFKTVSKEEMIKILEEEGFEVIDKESKKEGKWFPKKKERYWFRNIAGTIGSYEYTGDTTDEHVCKNSPIFPTKEECERYWHFMDTVKEKSYEFSKEEWEDDRINKYSIQYFYGDKTWFTHCTLRLRSFGEIYFKDRESAQYIIDNFKDELMEYFCISGDNKW